MQIHSLSGRKYQRVCSNISWLITEITASRFELDRAANLPSPSYQLWGPGLDQLIKERGLGAVQEFIASYFDDFVAPAQKRVPELARQISTDLSRVRSDFARLNWYLEDRMERIRDGMERIRLNPGGPINY